MTIMDIILNLQRYSIDVLAYKLDAEFAAAVDAAANLLEAQGERIADLEIKLDEIDQFEKWIPVTEKMPDNFVSVLGFMTDAGPFPAVLECYSVGDGFFFPALEECHPVSHWKPLPLGVPDGGL